ncbi:N-acetylglucosamine kinase [Cetobacterium sp.]|uniref:N-acetylglucosamine kinase n=1 Tax=Cetobacterium sp. TaxID=2071632 RepID=UPI003F2C468F
MYKIGVDGGGTKTTATIYNDKMEVLGHFLSGPMNLQVVSVENIVAIFKDMLEFFEVKAEDVEIGVGAAGAGRKEDVEKLENILKELNFKKYVASNDAHIALLANHGKNDGMLLISGTGSIAFGLKGEELYRKGGLGHILGDEGSGYSIGLDLLKAIFKALDNKVDINERVLREIFEIAKVDNKNALLKWVYSNEKGEIAKLAIVVLRNSKNEMCKTIIDKNVQALKELVVDLKNECKTDKIGFAGGIIENDTPVRRGLLKELEKIGVQLVERTRTNDHGATLLLD